MPKNPLEPTRFTAVAASRDQRWWPRLIGDVRRIRVMVERAAFVCEHVSAASRPVLLVSHEGGDWQFLCGGEDHGSWETSRVIGINHLFDRDASLRDLFDLPVGWDAERTKVGDPWARKRSQ